MREPLFRRDGAEYVPSGHARGPWDPGQLHGGAPAALIGTALQEPGFAVARVTFEFLAPVPLAPLTLGVELVKRGRRVQLVRAELAAGGRTVVRAHALRLRSAPVDLLGPAAGPVAAPVPLADAVAPSPFPKTMRAGEGFLATAMELRHPGATLTPGRGQAWFRLMRPLIDDEPLTPLARVLAAADFGNGISRVVDFDAFLFVNADLTVHLHREPAGEWVAIDATTVLEADAGIGVAHSTLHDERGPLGVAAQSLFVEAR